MTRKFHGLRTAIYKVSDIDQAKRWYTKVLGFAPYFDESFYVGFNVGGFELGLIPDNQRAKHEAGGVTAYWGVDDVSKTYNDLIVAGASPCETPKDVGGDIVVASVRDPWGNLFGIIYNPGFSVEP